MQENRGRKKWRLWGVTIAPLPLRYGWPEVEPSLDTRMVRPTSSDIAQLSEPFNYATFTPRCSTCWGSTISVSATTSKAFTKNSPASDPRASCKKSSPNAWSNKSERVAAANWAISSSINSVVVSPTGDFDHRLGLTQTPPQGPIE